jgi:hypothetical protein
MKEVGVEEIMHTGSAQYSDGLALDMTLSVRTETPRCSESEQRWRDMEMVTARRSRRRRAQDGRGDFTVWTSRQELGLDGP